MKDYVFLILGLILGLFFGLAIYWLPLGQFFNECGAIWSLACRRTTPNQKIKIGPGDYRCSIPAYPMTISNTSIAYVWRDEGVTWFFSSKGWVRRRVLHIYFNPNNIGTTYLASHKNILNWEEK